MNRTKRQGENMTNKLIKMYLRKLLELIIEKEKTTNKSDLIKFIKNTLQTEINEL